MRGTVRIVIAVLALGLSACASSTRSASGSGADESTADAPRSDRSTLVAADLERAQQSNLYDIIRALRPHWLDQRAQTATDPIQVYMDNSRLGGIEVLRTMTTTGVTRIRFMDPAQAQGRYGMNHRSGAIVISTERR